MLGFVHQDEGGFAAGGDQLAIQAADLVIGGRMMMRDHKLLTLDEAAAIDKAREYKKSIAASLGME